MCVCVHLCIYLFVYFIVYFIELFVYNLTCLASFSICFITMFSCVARVTAALLDKINKNLSKNKIRERRAKEEIRRRYEFSVACFSILFTCEHGCTDF